MTRPEPLAARVMASPPAEVMTVANEPPIAIETRCQSDCEPVYRDTAYCDVQVTSVAMEPPREVASVNKEPPSEVASVNKEPPADKLC